MPLASAYGLLDQVDGGVVLVGGDFVTNQVPHAFLGVKFRVIGRQIFDGNIGMGVEELLNSWALVPGGTIDGEIDFRFPDSVAEVFQKCQKAVGIPLGPTKQTMPALQGLHPAKQVQSLVVLTGGRDRGLTASHGPDPAELGVQ